MIFWLFNYFCYFFSSSDKGEKVKLMNWGPYWDSGPEKPLSAHIRTLSAVVTTSEPPPIATQLSVKGDDDDDIDEEMETDLNLNVVKPVPEKIKSRSREAQFIEVRRAKKIKLTDDDANQNETKAPGMDREDSKTKVGLMFFPST